MYEGKADSIQMLGFVSMFLAGLLKGKHSGDGEQLQEVPFPELPSSGKVSSRAAELIRQDYPAFANSEPGVYTASSLLVFPVIPSGLMQEPCIWPREPQSIATVLLLNSAE